MSASAIARARIEKWVGSIFSDPNHGTLAFTEYNPTGGMGVFLNLHTGERHGGRVKKRFLGEGFEQSYINKQMFKIGDSVCIDGESMIIKDITHARGEHCFFLAQLKESGEQRRLDINVWLNAAVAMIEREDAVDSDSNSSQTSDSEQPQLLGRHLPSEDLEEASLNVVRLFIKGLSHDDRQTLMLYGLRRASSVPRLSELGQQLLVDCRFDPNRSGDCIDASDLLSSFRTFIERLFSLEGISLLSPVLTPSEDASVASRAAILDGILARLPDGAQFDHHRQAMLLGEPFELHTTIDDASDRVLVVKVSRAQTCAFSRAFRLPALTASHASSFPLR